MRIIGFGHRARQGKNTAAIAVLNASPVECRARFYAYADEVKAEVRAEGRKYLGGIPELIKTGYIEVESGVCHCGAAMEGHSKYNHGAIDDPYTIKLPPWVVVEEGKPRTLLQWWGTDYRRAQDEDYWVKRLAERLGREQPDLALITDVRFPNEVEAIHKAGGHVVKVIRTTAPDIVVPGHPSEDALEGYTGWDYEIKAANLPELRAQAAAVYHKIVGTPC